MDYNINIIKKNVKNITIKIKNSKTVIITAPKHVSEQTLKELLIKQKKWILKHLQHFIIQENYISKNYDNGDSFNFLGISYPLTVLSGTSNSLTLENSNFLLVLSNQESNNSHLKEKIFKEWYKSQAHLVFHPILTHFLTLLNEDISTIKYSFMSSRWGSCNFSKRSIHLNLELLKKNIPIIEYVVLHEICHLKFPNHQKEFWNYLESYMPDWKLRRKELKN